jgi:putative ABC transport system substrate-binding protein
VEEIEAVVRGVGGSDTGMVVMPDTFTTMHRQKIIDAAAKHRVVAIYPFSYMVRDGGLISYGVDVIDLFRQAASYVDRILRGTSPAELPVQEPTKLELFITLRRRPP